MWETMDGIDNNADGVVDGGTGFIDLDDWDFAPGDTTPEIARIQDPVPPNTRVVAARLLVDPDVTSLAITFASVTCCLPYRTNH